MSLVPADLDVAILSSLVGTALDARTLATLRAVGHPQVRRAHGFVFQHLIDDQPTVSQLAERLGVTQQAASKSVAELETLGYVRREPDPLDSRRRRVALTDHGEHVIAISRQVRVDLTRAVIEETGEHDMNTARRVLIALLGELDATSAISTRSIPLPSE